MNADILIVDDVASNLIILENIITAMGHTARCVQSVGQAIDKIREKLPDIIFTDISMPDVSGIEFIDMLKNNISTRDIPIVVITGVNDVKDVKKLLEMNVVGFIPKPYNRITVEMLLKNQLKYNSLRYEYDDLNKRYNNLLLEYETKIALAQQDVLIMFSKRYLLSRGMEEEIYKLSEGVKNLALALTFTPKYEGKISGEFHENLGVSVYIEPFVTSVLEDEDMEVLADNIYTNSAREISLYQWENYDGSGPLKMKGEDIPLSARVAKVAKMYYYNSDNKKELEDIRGTILDPYIMDVYEKITRHKNIFN